MGLKDGINKIREGANNLKLNGGAIREAATRSLDEGYRALKGSGSVMTEIGRAGKTCADLPLEMGAKGLQACAQLLTFQPVEATCTVAKGLTEACGNLAALITSPIPITAAACEGALKVAGTVIKAPIEGPLAVGRTVKRGLINMTGWLGSLTTPDSSSRGTANDNGKSVAPPAEPAPAALAA